MHGEYNRSLTENSPDALVTSTWNILLDSGIASRILVKHVCLDISKGLKLP
jgi:hypothetical protein